MRLLAHLIVADIRRHRWLIGVWLAVLVGSTVLQGLRPSLAAEPTTANTIALLDALLTMVRVLLRILLIALLVQTHPLVGSDAFWLTRPIPPLMLLRAKAIVLTAVFVLAPLAAEAVLMTISRVPPSQIVRVLIDSAVFAAQWVALLSTAAALTPTFPRFLLLCGGVLTTLALFLAIQLTINSMTPPTAPVIATPPGAEDPTGFIVVVVMLTVACAVTLVAQYKSRRLWRSALIAVVTVTAALFGAGLWPWPFLQATVERPAWATREGSLPVVVQAAAVRSTQQENEPGKTSRRSAAPVFVPGLEPEWSAGISLLQATLQLEGGPTLTSTSAAYPLPVVTDDMTPSRDKAIRGVIGSPGGLTADPEPMRIHPSLLIVPESEFARVAPARGHYHGRFHLQLTHHEIEVRLPLQRGAEARNGGYRVVVDSAVALSGQIALRLRESEATSNFDRRPHAERTYYIRNRGNGAAFEGRATDWEIGVFPRMLNGFSVSPGMSGFRTEGHALRFPPPWVRHAERPDDTWLRDADLIVVRSTAEGGVERSLDIDQFPLDATAPDERQGGR